MSTPEVKVKKQIRKILDELGVYYAMPIGTGYGNSGVPDFLVCAGGKFVGILTLTRPIEMRQPACIGCCRCYPIRKI